jgi:superfamily II DNA or RNA helicase
MQIIIRRSGTLIDVSPDGFSPLPRQIGELLMPLLTYQYKKLLRGAEAFDYATGDRHHIQIENRYLYTMEQGRLTTGYGFIPAFMQTLQRYGHEVHVVDISPPRERPNCYEPDWDALYKAFQFRPRQEECIQLIASLEGGVIKAAPGFGKTEIIGMAGILFPNANIHVVVKPVDVAKRIVRRLTRFFPNVGQVGGGKRTMGRVTVFTGDSLHLSDCDADFLMADEGHMLMPDTYAEQLSRYRITKNFTFSATPHTRMDGTSARMQMFFGPVIFDLPYAEAVALGLTVPIKVRWLDIALDHNPADEKTGTAKDRWGIWRNADRNAIIAHDIHTNNGDPNKQVLVLCATFEHAVNLWQHLPEFELCYAPKDEAEIEGYIRSRMLPRGFIPMTPQRRDAMRAGFEAGTLKKVICTDVWSTGVDFEQLQVLYRADARESEDLDTQGPGRTSRIFEGKEYGEVVDCFDRFDTGYRRKSETRRRHYKTNEWEQVDWPLGRGRRQISHA